MTMELEFGLLPLLLSPAEEDEASRLVPPPPPLTPLTYGVGPFPLRLFSMFLNLFGKVVRRLE
jgi:hypothetical protein